MTYRTRAYHALAHDFRIESELPDVGRYLDGLLAAFPEADRVGTVYTVAEAADDDGVRRVEVRDDDRVVARDASVGALAGSFVHHVNQQAISLDYAVTCHAGGVERDEVGFVFPAHMESGKTTLTAGLVRAGFGYLTDEAVAFDARTGLIEPFPKPLSIDAGSHSLFPELRPAAAPGDDVAPADQWQVPPDAIRAGAVGRSCRARFVIFPAYEDGARTALEPMPRAAALLELATNTFSFRDEPRRCLERLGTVIEDAEVFRLTIGDLRAACDLVAELGDRTGART
jgi:hypothetical protein